MDEDDITHLSLYIHTFLLNRGVPLDEDDDWDQLHEFMQDFLGKFVNKQRNYN